MPEITLEGGGLIVVAIILVLREVRSFLVGMGNQNPENMRARVLEELVMLNRNIGELKQQLGMLVEWHNAKDPSGRFWWYRAGDDERISTIVDISKQILDRVETRDSRD